MTPLRCFRAKIGQGLVPADIGMPIADMVDAAQATYAQRMAAHDAALAAATDVLGEAEKIALRRAEIAVGTAEAQLNVLKGWQQFERTYGGLIEAGQQPLWQRGWKLWEQNPHYSPLSAAMRSFLTQDKMEIATWSNVSYEARVVRGQAHRLFAAAIREMQPKMFGLKMERALEMEVLDVLYDPAARVSPQARTVADAWTRTAEHLRQSFVDAKGALPERKNWRLPQGHDTLKVRSVSKEDWKAFVLQRLDREDMLDFETGAKLSDDRLDALLDAMYERIASGGADGMPSAAFRGQGMLASRRAEARILSFRDATAWREYQETFGGTSSVWEIMTGHIQSMSDDIAMLKVLGPNPEGTKAFMLSLFDREGARLAQAARLANPKDADAALKINQKIEAQVRSGRRGFENLWAEVTNANDVPVNIELARGMSELRGGLVSVQMGSAVISSLADPAFMMMASRWNGIPAAGAMKRAVAGMMDKDFEIKAAQMGVVADSIVHVLHATDRFNGESIRSGKMAQLGSAVIRASGLRRWTGVNRAAFAMEAMAYAANQTGKRMRDLDPQFQAMLNRYGIDEAGWDMIRKAEMEQPQPGAPFLTAASIRALGGDRAADLGDRWSRAIHAEMDHAVIEPTASTAAFVKGSSQAGTGDGEVRRALGMYKSFAITLTNQTGARFAARGWDGSRMGHMALTMSVMTLMGMVSFQAKQVLSGKDPVSMDPTDGKGHKAWGAALLQGGGLGIFGDLLFQDQTRISTSFATTLAGPIFSTADKVLGDFLIANIQRAWKGEQTHFAGDALYAAAALVPGSSLWYARTVFQRGVVDQLALMIDDRAPERFARIERDAEKQWGQSFWYEPGRVGPSRAPDLSVAAGGR